MTWVKVDDHFAEHPKMAAVGPVGWGVWLAGLAYCNRNLTDGFIPFEVAEGIGGKWRVRVPDVRDPDRTVVWTIARVSGPDGEDMETEWVIDLLVSAGLWDAVAGGYQVHDYGEFQPLKADVVAERERRSAHAKAAGAAGGRAKARNAEAHGLADRKQTPSRVLATGLAKTVANPSPVPVPVVTTNAVAGSEAVGCSVVSVPAEVGSRAQARAHETPPGERREATDHPPRPDPRPLPDQKPMPICPSPRDAERMLRQSLPRSPTNRELGEIRNACNANGAELVVQAIAESADGSRGPWNVAFFRTVLARIVAAAHHEADEAAERALLRDEARRAMVANPPPPVETVTMTAEELAAKYAELDALLDAPTELDKRRERNARLASEARARMDAEVRVATAALEEGRVE